jgi:hypothetical protein
MPNTFTNSYAVFKESFLILRKDKTMLIFPMLSGIACAIAILSFVFPAILSIDSLGPFSLLLFLVCYLAIYFICIFFSSAMIIYASLRLKGEKPSVLDAIKIAGKNSPNILLWALFSATIGIVLELIDKIIGKRFDFLTSILGTAWSLATFFVIPVMVFENKTPLNAMKESAVLFKKRWGETITGWVGIGLYIILLWLLGILLLAGAAKILPDTMFLFLLPFFIAYTISLVILYNALNAIYVASLYHFATTGEAKGGFSGETIRNAGILKRALYSF